jgi:hypothetical protein
MSQTGLIDDRLRVEIQSSDFPITELTHDNLGAYWEAVRLNHTNPNKFSLPPSPKGEGQDGRISYNNLLGLVLLVDF